jgi:ABC transport system ATP-binding/permease protein
VSGTAALTLLGARGLGKAYGPSVVLEGLDLSIAEGERVGLVGVNGSGKSTLARILAGVEEPDVGEVARRRGATLRYLEQEPAFEPGLTARAAVTEGLKAWAEAKGRYERASAAIERGEGELEAQLAAQAEAASDVERLGGWSREHEVDSLLGHLSVPDPGAEVARLSGGERRRVALARLLIARPDLAILDEPTNHLDVETIAWLEEYLLDEYPGALLLVTHDRYLLDRVTTRTLELSRGVVYDYDGGYERYLEAKAERLLHEARTEANRQNFLRRELEWLRRQPKARTTKQKARIDRAESAKAQKAPPKELAASLALDGARSGKTILEARGLGVAAGGRRLVSGLDLVLTQGERVGIVGRNGAGKTTLLRALVGEAAPAAGEVVRGQNTKLSYFDQQREELDLDKSIFDNVVGDQPKVELAGEVLDGRTYLERFLFDAHKQRQPVRSLSGGERARVALARLLRQPANLLVFDEPTNDLDVATLAALEDLLTRFDGTSLVVTHDRYFLDRVATSILHLAGDGTAVKYAGNYGDFEAAREAQLARKKEEAQAREAAASPRAARPAPARKGLSRAERAELDGIVDAIGEAEARVAELEARLGDPEVYARGDEVKRVNADLALARDEVVRLNARWEELEAKAADGA